MQTLICLLNALETGTALWRVVTIEPDIAGDKVDILWANDNDSLAQQVKSSKNQIGRAAVEAWCLELSQSGSANRYQLMLAGPIAAAVLEESPFHGGRGADTEVDGHPGVDRPSRYEARPLPLSQSVSADTASDA
ncbi:hypothetical protein [Rhizobium indigoferae]|uniref:DUF4143 domain-containing protein n=1 Tax=Rhizobium indigoferae TaxID=158891 RepID=A0ABZ1DRA1_9HYPH|nr:hypothetical protein [Rhizobium indigoferae]NNU57023.1 hypothetical protein [Rhizobium indigoferae]WRW37689.1 hypothetical protein U5G49_007302 [Rhizobium indigoferae]GLR60303.1 hypothetical protein GCM10007919_50310 [Rhizobium indigoferae]